MPYTLGIDLDVGQVKLCLMHVEGPQKTPYVDWLIFPVSFQFGPDYYCEFGTALMETLAHFLFVKKLEPRQLNKIYFSCGMAFSPFSNFEEGLHYLANVFIQSLFDPEKVGIVRADGKPFTPREVVTVKGESASAFVGTQFYGSAYIASRMQRNAIVLETGSRHTHITPVMKGRVDPVGRRQLSKYLRARLAQRRYIHRGSLFTALNHLGAGVKLGKQVLPFSPRLCRLVVIASLLRDIHPEIAREHDFPLLDKSDAQILLARAVGLDRASVTDAELMEIAKGCYRLLSDDIGSAFKAQLQQFKPKQQEKLQLVTTGLSGKWAAEKAFAQEPDLLKRFVHYEDLLPHRLHEASSAYGLALYAMELLMDETIAPDRVEVLP